MNSFTIYLNMDTEFSSSYVEIHANKVEQINDTSVKIDDIYIIDFNNEILSIK